MEESNTYLTTLYYKFRDELSKFAERNPSRQGAIRIGLNGNIVFLQKPRKFLISEYQPDKCCITLNLSAMQTRDLKAEIAALEIQLKHLTNLLDLSIRNNEILAKTKVIYHDLKRVSDKLERLKEMNEGDGQPIL